MNLPFPSPKSSSFTAASACREDAEALAARFADEQPPQKKALHVVASSYDTGFEAIGEQIITKCQEIHGAFVGLDSLQIILHLVDDTPEQRILKSPLPALPIEVQRHPLKTQRPSDKWGHKGLALREGFVHALSQSPGAVAYINLNLKAHAAQLATAFRRLFDEGVDVAVGSRAAIDGGKQAGAGTLGVFKSRLYNRLAIETFPCLANFKDTNGPMKVMSTGAAQAIVDFARIDDVGLDVEWLMIWKSHGYSITRFPLHWQQRPGSSPPWSKTATMLRDLSRLEQVFKEE